MVNDYGMTPNLWRPLEVPSPGPDTPTRPLTDEVARRVVTEYGSVFGSTPYLTHWGYSGTWKHYQTTGIPPGDWVLMERIPIGWFPTSAWALLLIPMWGDYGPGSGFLDARIEGVDPTGGGYLLAETVNTIVIDPVPGRVFACGVVMLMPWVPWVVPRRMGMSFATGQYTGAPPTDLDEFGSSNLASVVYQTPLDPTADLFHTDAPLWIAVDVRSRVGAGGGGFFAGREATYIGCDVWAILPTYWRS